MKVMYPALFEKEDSRYNVTFPDLPEAITCGDTLEQAIEKAKECLGLCLDVRKENKEEIPVMSDSFTINYANGVFIRMIELTSIKLNKRYNKRAISKMLRFQLGLMNWLRKKTLTFQTYCKMR